MFFDIFCFLIFTDKSLIASFINESLKDIISILLRALHRYYDSTHVENEAKPPSLAGRHRA